MKKIIFSLVAIFLVMTIFLSGCSHKSIAKLSIDDTKGKAGEIVEVAVKIKKNPGIWGGQIIIDYDNKNFIFVSATNGNVFETCESNDTGQSVALVVTHVTTPQATLEDSTQNGTVAVLRFKIRAGAQKGEKAITFNEDTNFCNSQEELIDVELNNGTIKVK